MFTIVKTSTLKRLKKVANILEWELEAAEMENKRLFDILNKRTNKKKLDAAGRLRNDDGTFARQNENI